MVVGYIFFQKQCYYYFEELSRTCLSSQYSNRSPTFLKNIYCWYCCRWQSHNTTKLPMVAPSRGWLVLLLALCNALELFGWYPCASSSLGTGDRCKLSMVSTGSVIADLAGMSVKDALKAVGGERGALPQELVIPHCDIERATPSVCKYIIANPKAFVENDQIAMYHGFDNQKNAENTPLSTLAEHLPVIYIADVHSEYGTLGLLLNKPSVYTLGDPHFHPEFRAFRQRRIYMGGVQNRCVCNCILS